MEERESEFPWKIKADNLEFEFKLIPEIIRENEGAKIELKILENDGDRKIPVDNAEIKCTANMPDLPGHLHILFWPKGKCYLEKGVGEYTLAPMKYDMAGKWNVNYNIKLKDKKYKFVIPVEVK
jgi:hypothetical protein